MSRNEINSEQMSVVEAQTLTEALRQPDYTKPWDVGVPNGDLNNLVGWFLNGDMGKPPDIGEIITNVDLSISNYGNVAALLTPVPGREQSTIDQVRLYSNEGIPIIIIFQSQEERNFLRELMELSRVPMIAYLYDGFGPDIWFKRTFGTAIANENGVFRVIHHDSDIELGVPLKDFLFASDQIFSYYPDAAAVSFPVKQPNDKKELIHFKPKSGENIIKKGDYYQAAYGTAGCFCIISNDRLPNSVFHYSVLRGLYGEWVPFSGVMRTDGRFSYYPENPFDNYSLFVVNKPDEVSADVLNKRAPNARELARVIVAGAQTFIEFTPPPLYPKIDEFLKDRQIFPLIQLFSGETNYEFLEIINLYADINNFFLQWYERYIKTKILDKTSSNPGVLTEARQIAEKEIRRRMPFSLIQRDRLYSLVCQTPELRLIPPFYPINNS